jgi:hypothetical protein
MIAGEDGAAAVDVAHQVLQAIEAFAARHKEGGSRGKAVAGAGEKKG